MPGAMGSTGSAMQNSLAAAGLESGVVSMASNGQGGTSRAGGTLHEHDGRRMMRADEHSRGAHVGSLSTLDDLRMESDMMTERSSEFWKSLDNVRKDIQTMNNVETYVVGSVATVASGLTVGYVIWIVRSGFVVTTMLAQLPVWTFLDPAALFEDQTESLAGMIESGDSRETIG